VLDDLSNTENRTTKALDAYKVERIITRFYLLLIALIFD